MLQDIKEGILLAVPVLVLLAAAFGGVMGFLLSVSTGCCVFEILRFIELRHKAR